VATGAREMVLRTKSSPSWEESSAICEEHPAQGLEYQRIDAEDPSKETRTLLHDRGHSSREEEDSFRSAEVPRHDVKGPAASPRTRRTQRRPVGFRFDSRSSERSKLSRD